jgi:hypothetical protein
MQRAIGPVFDGRGGTESKSSWSIDLALRPTARARGQRKDFARNRFRLDERSGNGNGNVVIIVVVARRRIDASVVRLTRCGLRLWRAAICSRLDLVDRDHAGSQQAQHDSDPARDGAVTSPPTSDRARLDAEQPRDTLLRDTERAKSLAGVARE